MAIMTDPWRTTKEKPNNAAGFPDDGRRRQSCRLRRSGYQTAESIHDRDIALWSQPGNDSGRHLRHERVMVDDFGAMNVRDMKLDNRAGKHLQRIKDSDRREGEGGCRIDHDAGCRCIDRLNGSSQFISWLDW